MQASLGLGGNVHQLYKPFKSPPTIYKGDTRHLDADEVPLVPPVPWRHKSESRPNRRKADGWPSALDMHLFTGFSTVLIIIWMWFYNIHLKLAGFTWQMWSKATTKQVLPTDPQDCLSFQDTFDKDNPIKPVKKKPKSKRTPRISKRSAALLTAMATLSSVFQQGRLFQLQSDMTLRRHLRRYRNCFGGLDSNKIRNGHAAALMAKIQDDEELFSAVTGNNEDFISTIVDTGSSFCITGSKSLIVPGTLHKIDKPIEVDGIASGLYLEWEGLARVETVLDNGDLYTFEFPVYYVEGFSCTLFSPQAVLAHTEGLEDKLERGEITQEAFQKMVQDHFRIYSNRMEWHAKGKMLMNIPYDSVFLPRLTLFPAGKCESSMKALLSTLRNSNKNLTPLQKLWSLLHAKLGHVSFSLVQKLGADGALGRHALELSKLPLSDRPMCES